MKIKTVSSLKRRGYKVLPLKRVNISENNGKMRPLGIPTMRNRVMQAPYLMALEPVTETEADANSYGSDGTGGRRMPLTPCTDG
ncbi:hypothetical protein [Parabacteroides sp. ZJ-118]|uniref:hypothetical protein n=1 Tax=Parabacteroides sp. ZJ-118 TaxID=2709398 RepID=UPI001F14D700|nr:hypothetical protein [Parabacteroides sp. ZJ-118]